MILFGCLQFSESFHPWPEKRQNNPTSVNFLHVAPTAKSHLTLCSCSQFSENIRKILTSPKGRTTIYAPMSMPIRWAISHQDFLCRNISSFSSLGNFFPYPQKGSLGPLTTRKTMLRQHNQTSEKIQIDEKTSLVQISRHPLMKSTQIQKIKQQPKHWPIRRNLIELMGAHLCIQGSILQTDERTKTSPLKTLFKDCSHRTVPYWRYRTDPATVGPQTSPQLGPNYSSACIRPCGPLLQVEPGLETWPTA